MYKLAGSLCGGSLFRVHAGTDDYVSGIQGCLHNLLGSTIPCVCGVGLGCEHNVYPKTTGQSSSRDAFSDRNPPLLKNACGYGILALTAWQAFAKIAFAVSTAANGELCNGSTYDSDSYCLGSNPSSPAICLRGLVA